MEGGSVEDGTGRPQIERLLPTAGPPVIPKKAMNTGEVSDARIRSEQ